jgi:hypothetical protein
MRSMRTMARPLGTHRMLRIAAQKICVLRNDRDSQPVAGTPMTVIELPDEQAAALKAKAAAAGLTLEAWVNQLAAGGEPGLHRQRERRISQVN